MDFAASRGWSRIGESQWNELRRDLPDISAEMIRRAGLPVEAPWSGVRQHTFADLNESLREYSQIYQTRPDLRPYCREQVIAAKDRARWLAVRSKLDDQLRRRKETMVEWMLVWLSDPALFPAWIETLARFHPAVLLD